MQNFEFYAPTRMIFGKDTHKQVGKLVKEYGFKKVFVHYGGASAQKSGLLDTVLYERGNSKGCSAGRRYPYTVCNRKSNECFQRYHQYRTGLKTRI